MDAANKPIYAKTVYSVVNGNLEEKNRSTKPLGLSGKAIFMQVLMTLLANLSVLTPGMAISFPAITFDSLTNTTDPMAITKDQASWYASISAISIPIGCLISSYVLDIIGRKKTLIFLNILSFLSWCLMASSSQIDRDTMYLELMIARFIMGLTIGLSCLPGSIYCAEVVHKEIRGKVIIMTTMMAASGMLLSYIWGYYLPNDWRITCWFACGLNIFSLLLLTIFVPESPLWLASKDRITGANKSMRFFKGLPRKGSFMNSELRIDMELLREQSTIRNNSIEETVWRKFHRPEVYKPFFIMISFFIFQQLSGIFVVIVYAVQFSKAAGVSLDPFLTSVYIGLCRVLTTILVGFTMDKLGRRKPAMFSGFTMFLFMTGIAAYLHFEVTSWKWLPLFFLLGYIFTSTLGLLTLPLTMNSEVFPQNVRGLATGLTTSFSFFLSFFMIKFYPSISEAIGDVAVILFFGIVSLLSVVFSYCFLPETNGKTFDEIKSIFTKNADQS